MSLFEILTIFAIEGDQGRTVSDQFGKDEELEEIVVKAKANAVKAKANNNNSFDRRKPFKGKHVDIHRDILHSKFKMLTIPPLNLIHNSRCNIRNQLAKLRLLNPINTDLLRYEDVLEEVEVPFWPMLTGLRTRLALIDWSRGEGGGLPSWALPTLRLALWRW
ncbi:hypothetical protein Scep_011987 [Stephania cephalantha]|uniref:Uncharacterized protein n=1 Tax=Stephania cephalantha TaxID=152367 RepID=A0AAP0P719_9MAGN